MPASPLVPLAQYKIGLCYYRLSPQSSLDQVYTSRAIEEFQTFIEYYPKDEHVADAEAKIKLYTKLGYDKLPICMAKTHLSLSHDPVLKGVPKGWTLPIRDVLIYSGAKFLCPCAGTISLMPGTGSDPAYRRVDVDVKTGRVKGLF